MGYNIKIRDIEHINHNVLQITTDKPKDYTFKPGQATELSIDQLDWKEKKRPFTFTSLPDDKELQFTIKVYPSHDGVTEHLETLNVGDGLIIGDAWGAINYKGEGTFIAGGAGVTPFISIFKDLLHKDELKGNSLIFINKEERDIILKNNLEAWLGKDVNFVLSEEKNKSYDHGHIDANYLKDKNLNTNKPVYLCGPPPMMTAVKADLFALGLPKSQLVEEA